VQPFGFACVGGDYQERDAGLLADSAMAKAAALP